jgi:hypothetical protein
LTGIFRAAHDRTFTDIPAARAKTRRAPRRTHGWQDRLIHRQFSAVAGWPAPGAAAKPLPGRHRGASSSPRPGVLPEESGSAFAEGHLGGKSELPHPRETVVIRLDHVLAPGHEPLAPGSQGFGVTQGARFRYRRPECPERSIADDASWRVGRRRASCLMSRNRRNYLLFCRHRGTTNRGVRRDRGGGQSCSARARK